MTTIFGNFAGFADLSVTPQFGNIDTREAVQGVNVKARDYAAYDYADELLSELKLGAAYSFGRTSVGLSYGASLGDVRDLSHEFSLNARISF